MLEHPKIISVLRKATPIRFALPSTFSGSFHMKTVMTLQLSFSRSRPGVGPFWHHSNLGQRNVHAAYELRYITKANDWARYMFFWTAMFQTVSHFLVPKIEKKYEETIRNPYAAMKQITLVSKAWHEKSLTLAKMFSFPNGLEIGKFTFQHKKVVNLQLFHDQTQVQTPGFNCCMQTIARFIKILLDFCWMNAAVTRKPKANSAALFASQRHSSRNVPTGSPDHHLPRHMESTGSSTCFWVLKRTTLCRITHTTYRKESKKSAN